MDKIIYDYQFLQILRRRMPVATRWIVRRLEFDEPDRVASEEIFDSLSAALDALSEEIKLEEQYATPVEIPGLSEATKARLDGELPRFFCIDPAKLVNE
jgi:hypothetical protein